MPQHTTLRDELGRRRHDIPGRVPFRLVVRDTVAPNQLRANDIHERGLDDRGMLDVPAREAFGENLGQLRIGQRGKRILDDHHSQVGVTGGGQVAGLPQIARVLVMPVLHADAPEPGPRQRGQGNREHSPREIRVRTWHTDCKTISTLSCNCLSNRTAINQ